MSPPGRPACMLAKPSQRAPAASEAEGLTGIGAQYITGGRVAGALIGVARVRKAF